MGKLQLKTELRDKRDYTLNPAVRKVKNKSGVIEMRPLTCPECSEEFCNGRSCGDFNYDLYTRVVPKPPAKPKTIPMQPEAAALLAGGGGLKAGRIKRGAKAGGKKRTRSKSPGKKVK